MCTTDKLYTGNWLQWPEGVYIGVTDGCLPMIVRRPEKILCYQDEVWSSLYKDFGPMHSLYKRVADA